MEDFYLIWKARDAQYTCIGNHLAQFPIHPLGYLLTNEAFREADFNVFKCRYSNKYQIFASISVRFLVFAMFSTFRVNPTLNRMLIWPRSCCLNVNFNGRPVGIFPYYLGEFNFPLVGMVRVLDFKN